MGKLRYKGYSGTVEYDESVNLLVGKVLGLRNALLLYEGENIESLRTDFENAIDFYLKDCEKDGVEPEKPYSGNVVLRMTTDLHAKAVEKASSIGVSLNEFIRQAIQAAL